MKSKNILSTLLFAAVLVPGLVTTARADAAMASPPPPLDPGAPLGLLGQTLGTLTYGYINLDGTSTHADQYHFELSQPLAFGLDGMVGYDFTQTGGQAGARAKEQTLFTALRAFSTTHNWGKPYVEAGVGYAWASGPGGRDNSVIWSVAAGAEIQVTPRATVTPYVRYEDAPDLAGSGAWQFGVKGSYWIDSSWAVTAGLQRDDEQNTAVTVGTNFRF